MAYEFINPWYNPQSGSSTKTYVMKTEPVFEHRGVKVFKHPAGGFLHTFEDMAITHLIALNRTGVNIDNILDGKMPVCDLVADHLQMHGFSPIRY